MTADVVAARIPEIRGPGLVDQVVTTNVPHSCVEHSPTGFEWGYLGSGPADFALNILAAFVPPGSDGHPAAYCHRGTCSYTALALHQDFKREVIAALPPEGGTIRADDIRAWLAAHPVEPVPLEAS